ncbi:hypothetical protein CRM22_006849 [Opisthorchis felineus]|uniref:Uncharacterized protein n=2 Tax=Opisthorchis felineus TaxID=147828 RepID=A0A4S2LJ07_OPIFE|nr:hypothetical protein CRM22_006849 [Opisthorchis felineus]
MFASTIISHSPFRCSSLLLSVFEMQLTRLCLGRFIPWNYTPGATWGGKQRKVPRLTHARKSAFLDHMLLSEQNHRLLQNPCITAEVEAATLEDERRRELEREDQMFYDRYATQFHNRFASRRIEETWKRILRRQRFDI